MLGDIKTVLNKYREGRKSSSWDLSKFVASEHLTEFNMLLVMMTQYPNLLEAQFGSCTFTKEQLQQLLSALARNSSFKIIGLNQCSLDESAIQMVMTTLTDIDLFPELHEIRISGNPIYMLGAKAIADMIITRGEQFSRLSLQGCKLSDDGLAEIARALVSASCRVELLDIQGNSFTQTGLMTLVSMIQQSKSIKYLGISNILAFDSKTGPAFLDAVRKSPSLVQVEMSDNGISSLALRQALLDNPAETPPVLVADYEKTVKRHDACSVDRTKVDLKSEKNDKAFESSSNGCTIF